MFGRALRGFRSWWLGASPFPRYPLLVSGMLRQGRRQAPVAPRRLRLQAGLVCSLDRLTPTPGVDKSGAGTSRITIGSGSKAPDTGVPASHRAGRPRNTAPTALPSHHKTGVTQSRLLSPTTQFVEHLGNVGRPTPTPIGAHTDLLPVDKRWPIRRARLLTHQPHTVNAGKTTRPVGSADVC
jgi:hypothetical protein